VADLHDRVEELRREAQHTYGGPVEIPEEFREYWVSIGDRNMKDS
jgi:hypothetical protein